MTPAVIAVLAGVFFLTAPAVILIACRHFRFLRGLGPVVLCYLVGLILGLSGLLPNAADAVRVSVMEASLGLALPLLMFSVDVPAWGRVAGRAMVSMGLAVAAVVCVATVLFFQFRAMGVAQPEQLSGMAIGMYTGGVANLGAIKLALDVPASRFLYFVAGDTLIGGIYLLAVITIGARVTRRFLSAPPLSETHEHADHDMDENWVALLRPSGLKSSVIAVGLAAICLAGAVWLSGVQTITDPGIAVILLLTSFGLAASFARPIRTNPSAPALGLYLIFVFSLCVAAGVELGGFAKMDMSVLYFVAIATVASVAVHAGLCKLFKVDADTFLITSVAALMSPAFVPMVARALGNPGLIMSGMATGILGFAIGNYLGISVAVLLAR